MNGRRRPADVKATTAAVNLAKSVFHQTQQALQGMHRIRSLYLHLIGPQFRPPKDIDLLDLLAGLALIWAHDGVAINERAKSETG